MQAVSLPVFNHNHNHNNLFDDLFASFGIRDQARLTALSHPSGTSVLYCTIVSMLYSDQH